MERKERDKHTRIVVVDISNRIVGFEVDAVREVLRISRSVTEPPPMIMGGVREEYITGVGKLDDRLLILLDLEKVLMTDGGDQLRDVA
jgi:purine-binding chemotaxis protein CheW